MLCPDPKKSQKQIKSMYKCKHTSLAYVRIQLNHKKFTLCRNTVYDQGQIFLRDAAAAAIHSDKKYQYEDTSLMGCYTM
jgi:hypothetical protein